MVFKHFWSLLLVLLHWPRARGRSRSAMPEPLRERSPIQTGASVPEAKVTIKNGVSGYSQSATSGMDGTFRLTNIPPNPYHMEVTAAGFNASEQDVAVRNAIPVQVKAKLAVAGGQTSVTVEAAGADMLENDPSAHIDVDRSLILKLPSGDPGGGLSQAITYSTGGVAADGNGLFHPAGRSRAGQLRGGWTTHQRSAKQGVFDAASYQRDSEHGGDHGTPDAEFGDKSSLVAQITTRSGLGAPKMFGNVEANYGTFGTAGGSVGLGFGSAKFGNFIAADGVRSGRFLDTPEYTPIHDIGNNQTIFDRLDYQPTGKDAIHLNLFAARNWIQNPNSYDQLSQDQHQRVLTWSIAPGYQHTVNAHTLITVNPYIRKDQFNYYASRDPFADTPATQSQNRQLLNWGVKADVSTTKGRHNLKYGVDLKQTRLLENFGFGITDPTFNSPCVNSDGSAVGDPALTSLAQCAAAGFQPNVGDQSQRDRRAVLARPAAL